MGIIIVKLSQLRLSPLNQRRVKPSAVESMADDIAAHGLLQNLVAYEDEGLFYVFAGGRRYRGLKELAKRKQIKNSDSFPVEVRTKEEAIELSLAENFQREDMHPADSIRAFAALRDTGMDAEEIAARFGQAVSFVYKMLRLSALALADEYRAIGWHEVRATLDRPYDLYMKGSMYPATREPTEAEAARIAAIDAEIERLAEAEGEDSDRIEPLFDERDAITEGLRSFNAEQVAVGGVALWVSHDGSLGKSFYRAKAEPKAKAGNREPQPLYSNSLFADLTRIKTQIVQEAVAADPALALDVLLDSLAGQLLHGAHSYQMAIEVQAKTVATDVPDELMATSDVRPVEETMATRFASIPAEGRFEAIRDMSGDDKMALLAGLVAMTVDGTVFAGGSTGKRHHSFEQIARASGVDIAARWSAPIALFDKMRRAAMIDLLREECGAPSAENCSTIKKKGDLAVNVSGRLPASWLPAPMKIGAFDQPEADPEDFDPDMDGDGIEGEDMDGELADDEVA